MKRFVKAKKSKFLHGLPKIIKNILMFLSPSFLIFAYKGLKPKTFEDKLLNSLNLLRPPSFLRISGNRDVAYHFLGPKRRATHLVRIPRFRDDQSICEKKEKILAQINGVQLQKKHLLDIPIFIEKHIEGIPFEILNPEQNSRALEWLFDFQKKTYKRNITKDKISSEIKALLNCVRTSNIKYKKSIEESLKNLINVDHICVAEHGDFWAGNILFGNNRIYVLDWEDYKERGNYLYDPLFFLITNSLYTDHPNSLLSFYKNWTGFGRYSPILQKNLLRLKDAFSLDLSTIINGIPYVILKKIINCDPRINKWRNDYLFFQTLLDAWSMYENKISRYLSSFLKSY